MARTVWTSDGQFQVEVGTAEYERLVAEGREFTSQQPGEGADSEPEEGAFETWTVPQLKDRAEELEILDSVEGTGKSGAVTKGNLVGAINAYYEEHPDELPSGGGTLE